MAKALKVFRTPIGFHDAYVAAPSQKAALEAWGSDHNLFARGDAEIVTDPALTEEPLAKPGTVIKRLRGSTAEQIAALPPEPERKPKTKEAEPKPKKPKAAEKPRRPRPDRNALDAAEQVLAEAETRHADARADLRRRDNPSRMKFPFAPSQTV